MSVPHITGIRVLSSFALAGLALSGCTLESGQETRTHSRPIIGGTSADAPRHDAVVSLHARSSSGFSTNIFCSGTLIAPDVVLTAGHCLDTASGFGPNFKTMSPDNLAIYFGDDPTSGDFAQNHVLVSQTAINPSYDRRALENDLALIRLAEPGPATPVANLPSASGFTQSDVGTQLDFAGFGYSDLNKTQINEKLHAFQDLGGLGCTVDGCPSGGSDPEIVATQISYLQDPEGPCNGDSGGPAFIQRDTTWYVGGVTSYGDSDCAIYGASTRVDAFETFIGDFVSGSGGGGGDGGDGGDGGGGTCEPDANGQVGDGCSCDSDADCQSGKCRGKPGAQTCK